MDLKNPIEWPISIWILAVTMALLGGFINFLGKLNNKTRKNFKIFEWLGEMFFCGFVGVLIFFALIAYDQPLALCAVGAAVGGHSSTRLVFLLDRILEKKINDNLL